MAANGTPKPKELFELVRPDVSSLQVHESCCKERESNVAPFPGLWVTTNSFSFEAQLTASDLEVLTTFGVAGSLGLSSGQGDQSPESSFCEVNEPLLWT